MLRLECKSSTGAKSMANPGGDEWFEEDEVFDEDHMIRKISRPPSSSISSQDSYLSTDDEGLGGGASCSSPSSSCILDHEASGDDEDDSGSKTKDKDDKSNMTPQEKSEAMRYLVSMNTPLVTYPSCLNYLMEDRIAAHKLSGMKTAKMLTGLCWTLSRPEVLSGPLITREMIMLDHPAHHRSHKVTTRLIPSPSLRGAGHKAAEDSIRIMQWNVLSQAIGYHCDRFATCCESDLTWASRKWKIIFEISQYSPDILCLQEVDRFYFIHKMLQKIGYDGKFVPKPDSPCYHLPDNTGPDGCAIFYNTNRFVLFKTSHRILRVEGVQSNQVALLCHFKCKSSGRVFAVCTTHLKARKSALLAAVRDEQGRDLLHFLDQECSNVTPFVITGDFNAESSEAVIKRMKAKLSSAYDDYFPPGFCPPSNWTQRIEEEETKQTVDYIFYQKDRMSLSGVLDLYSPDLIAPMPNDQYPSDHLSLVANFTLTS